jgi:site-specific DNA-cytosine methylase
MGTGGNNVPILIREKAYTIDANYSKIGPMNHFRSMRTAIFTEDSENIYLWRKLTVKECERLQTLPDDYTEGVSNSRRYKAIGNGWTVDVIAHILKYCNL